MIEAKTSPQFSEFPKCPGSGRAFCSSDAMDLMDREAPPVRKLILCGVILVGAPASASSVCKRCEPQELGDLLHRDSTWDALFVGHAGLFLGEGAEPIVDVAVGRKSSKALRRITLEDFKEGGSYWGAKALKGAPQRETLNEAGRSLWRQRVTDKIDFFMRSGVDYDLLHLTQKGGRSREGRFLFDCVGFTEHVWEYLGFNPTPDAFESGLGWPLTVREQRDSDRLEHVRG